MSSSAGGITKQSLGLSTIWKDCFGALIIELNENLSFRNEVLIHNDD